MRTTKARTKSAKISAKRGRPRIQGVERRPNGRIIRRDDPPNKIALEARARMLQIPVEAANNPEAGTWLGVLHLNYRQWVKSGNPDLPQPEMSLPYEAFEALVYTQEAYNDYLKAIGAKGAYYEPITGSGDEEAHVRWTIRAKEKWKGITDAIREAQNTVYRASNLWAALDYVVLREMAMPHMIHDVKCLGNCLARYFERGRK